MKNFASATQYLEIMLNTAISNFFKWYTWQQQMNNAVQSSNTLQVAFLLGQGFKLLFAVDPNIVFLSSSSSHSKLKIDYVSLLNPFWTFSLQFLNGSQFLTGSEYQNLVASIQTLNSTFQVISENLALTSDESQAAFLFAVADVFSEVYPLNQNFYALYISWTMTFSNYMMIFTKPAEILYNLVTYH